MIPYAPALESPTDLALRERYGLFIGGAWVEPAAGTYAVTENPATEEAIALVARASDADVDRAIRGARRAYDKSWRKLKASERAKYLYRIARALAERTRVFALYETLDRGFPIRRARENVARASATAFYYAGWADKLAWTVRGHERAHALGVVGALVSARSPLCEAIDILTPALAAGNTVVLKPSTTAPLVALALAQLCDDVDLPPGVLAVVTGDASAGSAIVEHADCDALAFAGDVAAGASVRRVLAGRRTRLRASFDGPALVVVYDDAPLDAAIEAIVASTHRTGSTAAAPATLVLVQESLAAELVARVTERMRTLRHGDPLDRNTDVGTFASRPERDRLAAQVDVALAGGARLIAAPFDPPLIGAYRAASLVLDLEPSFDIAGVDGAGPFVALATFRTPAEALERAASLGAATTASVWTTTAAQGLFTAQRLRADAVSCNTFGSPATRPGGLAGVRAYLDP